MSERQPESSEQRWERIERALALTGESLQALAQSQRESEQQRVEQRQEFEQFKRTMAAVIESLHQTDLRLEQDMKLLNENLTQLSAIVVHHHERLDDLEG